MGLLKVQDPPGSGNWVPAVPVPTTVPESDWGGFSMEPSGAAVSGTASGTLSKVPFSSTAFKGVGITQISSGLLIAKAGVYDIHSDLTMNSASGTGQWIIMALQVWRSGALFKSTTVVGSANAGFFETSCGWITDLLAGDQVFVYVQTSQGAGVATFDTRSTFFARQISISAATSGELVAGFRANATQSIPNAAVTTVALQVADHTCGGIDLASNIVTVATAGVYQLSATGAFNSVGAAGRRLIGLETWTGTDPGVGSATQLTREDMTAGAATYATFSLADQVYLAAGAKLRMTAYQVSGGVMDLLLIPPTRFNIRKVSQGGVLNDTGWIPMTIALGGPANLLNSGWTAYGGGYMLPAYKRIGNTVYFRGVLLRSAGAATNAFTAPVGFRATAACNLPTRYYNGSAVAMGSFYIDQTGIFTPDQPVNGSTYDLGAIYYDVL